MKLLTFETFGHRRIGAELNHLVLNLKAAHNAMVRARRLPLGDRAAMPSEMLGFIRGGEAALQAARKTLDFAARRPAVPAGQTLLYPMNSVKLLSPVVHPGKILSCEFNTGAPSDDCPAAGLSTEPSFHAKLPSCVIGPGEPILKPPQTQQLDCAAELAVVIGRKMKNTPENEVMAHVLGYTILNNVCARDIEADRGQMTLARNFDTFCAMGPFIVTADELSAPDRIGLRVFVNGQLWRSGQTADWPSPLPRLLSWLSQRLTLDPGDIVSTGLSPHPGPVQAPRSFLKPGDVVRLEADGIGVLENPVVE